MAHFRTLMTLLLLLAGSPAAAQYPSPVFNGVTARQINTTDLVAMGSVTTSGLNAVVYIPPYSTLNSSGVKTDCSADAQPAVQAAVNSVYLRTVPRMTIVLPAGCLGFGSELLMSGNGWTGPYAWTAAGNRSIEIVGAGRDATTVRALSAMTNLFHKDSNYSVNGTIRDLTLDGNFLASYVLNIEQSAQMHFRDLIIQNSAPGGVCFLAGPLPGSSATSTAAGQSYVENLEVNCGVAGVFPLGNRSAYAVHAGTTDWHWTNVNATGAAIADFKTSNLGAGNRYVNIHAWNAYGHGGGAELYQGYASYCFQLGDFISHYSQATCDGAQTAAVQVNAWNISFSGAHFGWQGGVTDSVPTYAKAVYTASISGNTMTVTAVATGTISVSDKVSGVNVSGAPTITALGTGTGGTGTYTISGFAQTAASTEVASNSAVGFQIANGIGNLILTENMAVNIQPSQGVAFLGSEGPNNIIQQNQGFSYNEGLLGGSTLSLSGDATVPSFWTIKSGSGNLASFFAQPNAVNTLGFNSSIAGVDVQIATLGADTNRSIQLVPNGTGIIKLLNGASFQGTSGNLLITPPTTTNAPVVVTTVGTTGGVNVTAGLTVNSNTVETQNNKGIASGYASLDSGIRIPAAQLPLATTSTVGGVTVSTGLNVSAGALSVAYGTTGTTAAVGNDGRITGAAQLNSSPTFTGTVSASALTATNAVTGTQFTGTTSDTGIYTSNGLGLEVYVPSSAVSHFSLNSAAAGNDLQMTNAATATNIQIVPGTGFGTKIFGTTTTMVGANGSLIVTPPASVNGNVAIGIGGSTGNITFNTPVVLTSASTLGTPTSATLTNATGLRSRQVCQALAQAF